MAMLFVPGEELGLIVKCNGGGQVVGVGCRWWR